MKLFFDLDGTLFQTELTVLATARKFFAEAGLPCPQPSEILCHVGRPMDAFMQGILKTEQVSEDTIQRFRTIERDILADNGKLFDGTEDMLKRLKEEGHSLYVCSNGSLQYIERVLSLTGIRSYFDDIYSAKASLTKAQRMGEILCGDCGAIFIGDTVDDLLAARQNQIPFIAALYGYGGEGALDEFAYRAATPKDIAELVSSIAQRTGAAGA